MQMLIFRGRLVSSALPLPWLVIMSWMSCMNTSKAQRWNLVRM